MAAAGSATSVETASATMESAAIVEAVAATEASAVEAPAKRGAGPASESAIEARTPVVPAAVVSAAPVIGPTIVAATVVCPRPAIVAATIVTVEPGTSADEEAVHKPIGAVVTVGSASIRIVIVVAVRADGSGAVHWTADADRDTHLGVRIAAKNEKQQAKQSCVLEIAHLITCSGQADRAGAAGGLPGRFAWGSGLHGVKHR